MYAEIIISTLSYYIHSQEMHNFKNFFSFFFSCIQIEWFWVNERVCNKKLTKENETKEIYSSFLNKILPFVAITTVINLCKWKLLYKLLSCHILSLYKTLYYVYVISVISRIKLQFLLCFLFLYGFFVLFWENNLKNFSFVVFPCTWFLSESIYYFCVYSVTSMTYYLTMQKYLVDVSVGVA